MGVWHVIGGGTIILALVGYIALNVSFLGFPHKCPKHGWNSGGICFGCEDEQEK